MQAVGRLGSYISKSVYTVSGPFHPFGGAVDIIVVLQPDGTYKSSPWYVRFGKFQGVLKTKEKLVNINVNGVEADFHMYLDHKGEAYFLKEVDLDDPEFGCSPPSSSGDDSEKRQPIKSFSCNYDAKLSGLNGNSIPRSNSRRSQLLGRVFGNRSGKVIGVPQEEDGSSVGRTKSMERAEIAADLLDLKWSTNLGRKKKDNASRFSTEDSSKFDEMCDNANSSYREVVSTEVIGLAENGDVDSVTVIKSEIGCGEAIDAANGLLSCGGGEEVCDLLKTTRLISEVEFEPKGDVVHLHPLDDLLQDVVFTSKQEHIILRGDKMSNNETCICHFDDAQISSALDDAQVSSNDYVIRDILSSEISNEELLLFGELDDSDSSESKHDHGNCEEKETCSLISVRVGDGNTESVVNDYTNDSNMPEKMRRTISSDVNINRMGHVQSNELTRAARSLPSLSALNSNFDGSDRDHSFDSSLQSVGEDGKMIKVNGVPPCTLPVGHPPRPLEGSQGSWPFSFKRSKSTEPADPVSIGSESDHATKICKTESGLQGQKEGTNVNPSKKKIRIGTPTSEQLASLNLKEGKNIVVFTFSTGMLGKQQVDARIFLWRWDTRVVISDVDGTITRSDLLGQFMPLVGMDWSHTGVAHLFSSIKDNGYQLLFLSARSISQAFLTRQFLFNINQDGKALPEGPVVISPDGLFPSLFREVVRRAPHEFKIACLEDIKALFPADTNPFYAGFGNRITDEVSYLKVGIPKNKIFIINPKGEIVVNRRIDTKSYSSLHTLVHGMFPSMCSSEQEDYNTWNYWKIPPPTIDV